MFNRRPSRAGAIIGSVHREPCADKQRVKGRTAPPVYFLPGRDFERDRNDELRPATLRVNPTRCCIRAREIAGPRYRCWRNLLLRPQLAVGERGDPAQHSEMGANLLMGMMEAGFARFFRTRLDPMEEIAGFCVRGGRAGRPVG
jgi:hypothetical protein